VTLLALYAGFSFAKYRYFGRQPVMLFMLSAQMFPFGLLLISIYPLMGQLNLLDTRLGLILSYIVFALPVSTYMLYSYFPGSRRADRCGACRWRKRPSHLPHHRHSDLDAAYRHGVPLFLHVVLERPALLDDAHRLGRQSALSGRACFSPTSTRSIPTGEAPWQASLIASAPIVLAFMFLQRYFIQGVTAGAVK
jgi:multiple sugar transport system permease protein